MIRRLLLTSAFAAVLMLAACASSTQITEGQSLAAAWSALGAAAASVDSLAKSGALHGANAQTAATDLGEATTALQAATAAYNSGDNTTTAAQVTAAAALVASIIAITQNPGS